MLQNFTVSMDNVKSGRVSVTFLLLHLGLVNKLADIQDAQLDYFDELLLAKRHYSSAIQRFHLFLHGSACPFHAGE